MIRCSLTPYEGKEKYIFVSYAHKDSAQVYPIIEAMASMNYRIWYDEGIDPGSEWPETIAEHLNGCEVCLAFLSSNYLESQNCRRELNFTLQKKKSFVTVLLEPVELSLGMEMQLSTTQSVSKYSFPNDPVFLEKLCSTKFLSKCLITEPSQTDSVADVQEPGTAQISSDADVQESAQKFSDIDTQKSGKNLWRNMLKAKKGSTILKAAENDSVLNKQPAKKRKLSRPLIAVTILAAVLLLFQLIRLVHPAEKPISIAGKNFKAGEISVYLNDVSITGNDVKKLSSMKQLKYLHFKSCSFEDGAAAGLGSLPETVTNLEFSECTGIGDYSIISRLANLSYLTIQNCELTDDQFGAIVFGESLTNVNLSDNEKLSDIKPLNTAKNLSSLVTDGTSVRDFKILSECVHLHTLSASNSGIQDISSLSGLTFINLTLENNQIRDLSPLAGNDKMRELELSGNQLTDISPLANMPNLTFLRISDNAVTSLLPLSACTKLNSLQADRNQLTSLNGLEHALELREISVAVNQLKDLSGLENCTLLTRVNLTENILTDISPLQKSLASLTKVFLGENQLADINALKGAAVLEALNVDNNMLTTLEPLAESSSLVFLSANHNSLTSLKGLENAIKLSQLYLAHNQLENTEVLTSLTENSENDYRIIDLRYNALQTLSLNTRKKYGYLAIYGNSFTSLDFLNNLKGTCLYLDYLDEINEDGFSPSFSRYEILGCPLDKQVATKAALKGIIHFSTAEELEDEIFKMRN